MTPKEQKTVHTWFERKPETVCAIFVNEDLGHPDCGRRMILPFTKADLPNLIIGKTTAPDTRIGLGWRYVLKTITTTEEDTIKEYDAISPTS